MAGLVPSLGIFVVFFIIGSSSAQLSTGYYSKSCPNVFETVKSQVHSAIVKEARMGASLLRLFFHDCFVNVIYFFTFHLTYKQNNNNNNKIR